MGATLVVETGAGLANANSYCTVAEADTYHLTRPMTRLEWSAEDQEKKTAALISATQWLDVGLDWDGVPVNPSVQALRWPRAGIYTPDGYALASDAVPAAVKRMTAEFARLLLEGDRPTLAEERATTGKSAASTSSSGSRGAERVRLIPEAVRMLGRGLYRSGVRLVRC